MKRILNKLQSLFWDNFVSAEAYARHIGVKIGTGCRIATRYWSSEPYLITIGNNVQITRGVSFYTHGGGNSIRDIIPDFDAFGKIKVEDRAYLGAFSQVMAGVTIGEGAIVAAGSIVTKSVEPHTVVGGNPAKYICTVDEFIHRNEKYNVHTYGKTKDEKKAILLSLPDDKFIKK